MPPGPDEDEDDRDEGPPRSEGPPDEKILAPEDLDFTVDEKVEQLDEGKFVIGTDSKPRVPPDEQTDAKPGGAIPERRVEEPSEEPEESTTGAESGTFDVGGSTPTRFDRPATDELTGRQVKSFISQELRRTDSQYAYRIAAKTGESVSHQQLASDDIGMAFDGLLMWYAQQVSSDTAVEDALGILLAKSNIRIRYPVKLLAAYLRQHDLSPDDDIQDLLEAIKTEDGLVFPPGNSR